MAQTPHQQIQVVQQQPVSSAQLQQLYFPHQQVLFPGNITLQQAASGQPTLQSIAPNRNFSNTPMGVLPKSIQTAIPVHSIGNQRQLAPQITTQAAGATYQPNFLGSFATLGPLPVGYQWATNCYQQNPIIIRSQHPNIYVQQPQAAIQLPISAAQQIVNPASYASNPHIQLETQTIATQTLVPSVTAVNSSNAYIQLDPNVSTGTKPSPSNSPSSSTAEVSNVHIQNQTNPPLLLSTQSMTHHILGASNGILSSVTETEITEIQSTGIQSEFLSPEKEQIPLQQKSIATEPKVSVGTLLANTDASCAMTVSSTTPTTVASISHLHSYVSSLGKRTVAMVNSPPFPKSDENVAHSELDADSSPSDVKDGSMGASLVQEQIDPVMKSEHFSPQKPIKNPYLGPLKEKQPQKAIVKPQMLSHVKDSSVEQEERESFLENLKPLADSPKPLPHEEQASLQIENSIEGSSPGKKPKVTRGRGRPRGRHGKFKQAERRRSLRQQSQIEILEVIERNTPRSSEMSDSQPEEKASSSSALPEIPKPEPQASTSTSSVASDIADVIEHKLDVDMPKSSPNTWSVEEVYEFIQGFPGCFDYAESFKSQEIDGQALLLIKLDHLMTGMSMKLGPAVKLIAHIRSMNEQLS